jgi:hypothetical protein
VPVARSDPRRATLIGIAGVVAGLAIIFLVLSLGSEGERSSTITRTDPEFRLEDAAGKAAAIEDDPEHRPIFFNDTADFSRPIAVWHQGDDAETGWVAYDAQVDGCELVWVEADDELRDTCTDDRYPVDGTGLTQYPVEVRDGDVVIDLNPDDDEPTTTSSESTTTIRLSG